MPFAGYAGGIFALGWEGVDGAALSRTLLGHSPSFATNEGMRGIYAH